MTSSARIPCRVPQCPICNLPSHSLYHSLLPPLLPPHTDRHNLKLYILVGAKIGEFGSGFLIFASGEYQRKYCICYHTRSVNKQLPCIFSLVFLLDTDSMCPQYSLSNVNINVHQGPLTHCNVDIVNNMV